MPYPEYPEYQNPVEEHKDGLLPTEEPKSDFGILNPENHINDDEQDFMSKESYVTMPEELKNYFTNNDIASVDKFLEHNKDFINSRDENGNTPLISLARLKPNFLYKLLKYGADVNAQNNEGKTALMYCVCSSEEWDAIDLLSQKGLNINIQDNNSQNALDYIFKGSYSPKIFFHLIKRGAQIAEDFNSKSILYFLHSHNHADIFVEFNEALSLATRADRLLEENESIVDNSYIVQSRIFHKMLDKYAKLEKLTDLEKRRFDEAYVKLSDSVDAIQVGYKVNSLDLAYSERGINGVALFKDFLKLNKTLDKEIASDNLVKALKINFENNLEDFKTTSLYHYYDPYDPYGYDQIDYYNNTPSIDEYLDVVVNEYSNLLEYIKKVECDQSGLDFQTLENRVMQYNMSVFKPINARLASLDKTKVAYFDKENAAATKEALNNLPLDPNKEFNDLINKISGHLIKFIGSPVPSYQYKASIPRKGQNTSKEK